MSELYERAGAALAEARLYVDPDATPELGDLALTPEQSESLAARLDQSPQPVRIAVLPAAASQVEGLTPELVWEAAGREPGTYLVLTGDGTFDAASTDYAGSTVDALAGEAYAASDGTLATFLTGFADRVDALSGATGAPSPAGTSDEDGDLAGLERGTAALLGAGALALLLGGSVLLWRRGRRRQDRSELAAVRPAVADDLRSCRAELDALAPAAASTGERSAEAGHARATRLLEQARHALDRAETAGELASATAPLARARWQLAAVRARLAGEPDPPERLPCFFDPRHGPSVQDVPWAPPGGAWRDVPACSGDAELAREGYEPALRELPLGRHGERRPYHEAGPAYAGWAIGYWGAAVPALLADTALGAGVGGERLLTEGGFDAGGGWAGGRGIETDPRREA